MGQAGAATGGAETVTLSNQGGTAVTFNTNVVTQDQGSWLSVTPALGSVPAQGVVTLQVQAVPAATAGQKQGTVRIGFADGTVRAVAVVSRTVATASGAAAKDRAKTAGDCTPDVVFESPTFSVAALQQQLVQLKVKDCRGNLAKKGSSVDAFVGPGPDGPWTAVDVAFAQDGVWQGHWTPATNPQTVTLLGRAIVYGDNRGSTQTTVTGSVGSASPDALAAVHHTYNSAS